MVEEVEERNNAGRQCKAQRDLDIFEGENSNDV